MSMPMKTNSAKLRFSLAALLLASCLPASSDAAPLYACAHKTTGQLRLTAAPGQCHNTEREVTWDDSSGLQAQVNTLMGRVTLLEQAVGVLNEAPTVNAGLDKTILLSYHAMLNGSVSDDGIIEPVTLAWTQVSGPGTAVFDNASEKDADVTFDAVGDYVLRMTAYDGLASVSDDVVVKVFPDNDPPVVDAGPDQTLTGRIWGSMLECIVDVAGTVADDGLPGPITVLWSGGSFIYNKNTLNARVILRHEADKGGSVHSFSQTITLSASDGFHTVSDSLTVTCNPPNL